ncbi:MAG: glycosyltransferase [Candidatus Falkowbacteria bacterium]
MKICLINNLYEPYAIGGAEQVVKMTFEGLKEAGHDVFIITTRPIFEKAAKERSVYYLPSWQFVFRKMPKFLRLIWHVVDFADPVTGFRIKKILAREKPDVVMTHNLVGIGFLLPRIIRNLRIRHVHVLHDIQMLHPSGLLIYGRENVINGLAARIYQFACRKLIASAAIVVSPSNWLITEHTKRGFFRDSRRVILPNPIPRYAPMTGEKRVDNKEFKLLFVGQIEPHKGIHFLIDAFAELTDKYRNFSLTFIGNGLNDSRYLSAISRRNIRNIEFKGRIPNEEVKRLMPVFDCLVVPSLCHENSPTVIYEAASLGLAVIASRIGGISELVRDLGGILFVPGSRTDLARKLIWASKNPLKLKEMVNKAKSRSERYILPVYIDKLTRLL